MRENIELTLKILTILGEGFQLKFERSKAGRRAIHENCNRIWHSIDRKYLYRTLDRLRLHGAIKVIKESDKIETLALTNHAKIYSLRRQFQNISIKQPRRWDKQWRMILFDIPESNRKKRDMLRHTLKSLGFFEFQKSVFVYPFPCKDEANFIMNFLEISNFVYYIQAPIVPDETLRKHFRLK